ncbi:helix-turn-helix transcriptional regulator [Umezawaea sp.]|uniref:helix-turn-helix domain-containing protein n=1 Tax=Umezawaea sp. TaxID=1955258 RepID=UPI002ED45CF5
MTTSPDNEQPSYRLANAHSRELGEELRRIRLDLGLKGTVVCQDVEWSPSKLSKLESGVRGASEADVATLLGLYRVGKAARTRVLGLATEPDYGLFVRAHHNASPDDVLCVRMHEATARTLTCYQPLLLPSLLHTSAYAEALLRHTCTSGEQLGVWLDARAARQEALHQEAAPEAVFFIHEAALRLVVGDTSVMHDQCLHLGFMAEQPRFTLRVIPVSTGHPALRHAVTLLTFAAPLKPLGYSETDTATVFFDEDTAIATVQRKFAALDRLVLGVEQSKDVFRHWADVYDSAELPLSGR